jgi:hypothetical protein
MLTFLLLLILLCLCPSLRIAVGALVWILVALVWWHWPTP